MDTQSLIYSMALGMIPQLNLSSARTLIEKVGSVEHFFTMSEAQLCSVMGGGMKFCSANYREGLLREAAKELQFVTDNDIRVISCLDNDYPSRLQRCDDAPVCLYLLGNCNPEAKHIVGIVGTRNATPYGVDTTRRIIQELSAAVPDLLIVSGLAYGIDGVAHRTSISEGTATLGVVAHGLDTIYPSDHRDLAARMVHNSGGIITEYPSGSKIHRSNFLARNRIVAGLCDVVLVVESDYKGGALSTARLASMYGREVYAVPGRINDTYSRGTNHLIENDTARIFLSTASLISSLGWDTKKEAKPTPSPALFKPLSPEQQQLIDFIHEHPTATVNEMCASLGQPFASLQDTLFQMEMNDLIVSVPGGRYTIL